MSRSGTGSNVYLTAVITMGAVAILVSLRTLLVSPVAGYGWFVLAALTILSGSATLRMPSVPVSFSISDTFTMTAALLFGPAAGTVAVALDGLAISLRLARRPLAPRRLLFNATAPALAMWVASHVFFALARVGPLVSEPEAIDDVLAPLAIFAATYFVLNTGLIAWAVASEQRAPIVSVWRQHFLGLWLTYFGGGSIAALVILLVYSRRPDFKMLALVLPLPLILYFMFKGVVDRLQEHLAHLNNLNRMHLATIDSLAQAIDAKDQVTHGHIRRVQLYAVRLAHELGVTNESEMRALEAAALLHDVGKLGVPEHILNKPAKLTPAEFETMKQHADIGAHILSSIDFPYPVVPIVRHHHENWDGTGYPARLPGTDIPIGARILAVVDCFDALTSDRPYRPRLTDVDALQVIEERRGTMYDPAVVDAFLKIHPSIASEAAETARERRPSVDADSRGVAGADGEVDLLRGEMAMLLDRMTAMSTCVLYVYDAPRDRLVARSVTGEHAETLRGLTIRLGHHITGWVAANRTPIVNSNAVLDLGADTCALDPPLRTCLSVPLTLGDQLIGTLTAYSTSSDGFSDSDRRVLETIAGKLAFRTHST